MAVPGGLSACSLGSADSGPDSWRTCSRWSRLPQRRGSRLQFPSPTFLPRTHHRSRHHISSRAMNSQDSQTAQEPEEPQDQKTPPRPPELPTRLTFPMMASRAFLANARIKGTGKPLQGPAQWNQRGNSHRPPHYLHRIGESRGGGPLTKTQERPPSHIPGQKTPSPEFQPTRARSFFSTSSSMSTNTGAISYVYLPEDVSEKEG